MKNGLKAIKYYNMIEKSRYINFHFISFFRFHMEKI